MDKKLSLTKYFNNFKYRFFLCVYPFDSFWLESLEQTFSLRKASTCDPSNVLGDVSMMQKILDMNIDKLLFSNLNDKY